jgi:hypothetical protein
MALGKRTYPKYGVQKVLNVYLDQNVLINCANHRDLHERFLAVKGRGVRFVLSPWHFYELGSIDTTRGEELVRIVESFDPSWILDRSDLQVAEFMEAWKQFYGFPAPAFVPIGTLTQAASALLHSPERNLAQLDLRDFVRIVKRNGEREIAPVLDRQRQIATANQASVREGLLTEQLRDRVRIAFGALMLARARETGPDEKQVRRDMEAVLRDPFTRSLLIFFLKMGQFDHLKAWQIEAILTDLHHDGTAVLNRNRLLDRQHAVTSLAYCDGLITDDVELRKLRDRVAAKATFQVGVVQTAAMFLRSFE